MKICEAEHNPRFLIREIGTVGIKYKYYLLGSKKKMTRHISLIGFCFSSDYIQVSFSRGIICTVFSIRHLSTNNSYFRVEQG